MPLRRTFTGLGSTDRLPDKGSILHFRHLRAIHRLAQKILCTVSVKLISKGLLFHSSITFDATLIAVPSSTKKTDYERDPELHQPKKANQWHLGEYYYMQFLETN